MERGDPNFEIIGAFGVSSWSATFFLVWGVVGLPEDVLPASLMEEISWVLASRVESRVSTSSSDSDSDPVSVISSDPRVSLLKAAQIRSSD
jgi:hypothetical protein